VIRVYSSPVPSGFPPLWHKYCMYQSYIGVIDLVTVPGVRALSYRCNCYVQAKEAETVLEVAKEEGVQNGDIAAAAEKGKDAKEEVPIAADAKKDEPADSAAAPAQKEADVKAAEASVKVRHICPWKHCILKEPA